MQMEVDDGSSSMIQEDIRWSLQEEVDTLIDDALKLSFSDLKEERPMLFSSKEEYGDYQWYIYILFLRFYVLWYILFFCLNYEKLQRKCFEHMASVKKRIRTKA